MIRSSTDTAPEAQKGVSMTIERQQVGYLWCCPCTGLVGITQRLRSVQCQGNFCKRVVLPLLEQNGVSKGGSQSSGSSPATS